MDGMGDMSMAKELRDSFSRQQPRPNRKSRMQQAAGKSHTTNTHQQQGGQTRTAAGSKQSPHYLKSVPRGDHSFQFGEGTGKVQSGNRPIASPRQKKKEPELPAHTGANISCTGPTNTTSLAQLQQQNLQAQQQLRMQHILNAHNSLSSPQPSPVVVPDPRTVFQFPLGDMTNHQSTPKHMTTDAEKDTDVKRVKSDELAADRSTHSTDVDNGADLGDLMSFDDSPPPRQTTNSPRIFPVAPVTTMPLSSFRSNQPQASTEDVFMADAQTSPTKSQQKHRRGLSASRWYTEEDEQQATPVGPKPALDTQPRTTHRAPVRIVESSMSRGLGLGGSRWAD